MPVISHIKSYSKIRKKYIYITSVSGFLASKNKVVLPLWCFSFAYNPVWIWFAIYSSAPWISRWSIVFFHTNLTTPATAVRLREPDNDLTPRAHSIRQNALIFKRPSLWKGTASSDDHFFLLVFLPTICPSPLSSVRTGAKKCRT